MQSQFFRQILQDHFAAHAVALRVQHRAVGGDPHSALRRGNDSAAHAALRRNADLHRELAGFVVHAAEQHQGLHGLHDAGVHHPLSGNRIHPVIRQDHAVAGQALRSHQDRAEAEIKIQNFLCIAPENFITLQEIRNGPVPVDGPLLRIIHLFAQTRFRVSAEAPHQIEIILKGGL